MFCFLPRRNGIKIERAKDKGRREEKETFGRSSLRKEYQNYAWIGKSYTRGDHAVAKYKHGVTTVLQTRSSQHIETSSE